MLFARDRGYVGHCAFSGGAGIFLRASVQDHAKLALQVIHLHTHWKAGTRECQWMSMPSFRQPIKDQNGILLYLFVVAKVLQVSVYQYHTKKRTYGYKGTSDSSVRVDLRQDLKIFVWTIGYANPVLR